MRGPQQQIVFIDHACKKNENAVVNSCAKAHLGVCYSARGYENLRLKQQRN